MASRILLLCYGLSFSIVIILCLKSVCLQIRFCPCSVMSLEELETCASNKIQKGKYTNVNIREQGVNETFRNMI